MLYTCQLWWNIQVCTKNKWENKAIKEYQINCLNFIVKISLPIFFLLGNPFFVSCLRATYESPWCAICKKEQKKEYTKIRKLCFFSHGVNLIMAKRFFSQKLTHNMDGRVCSCLGNASHKMLWAKGKLPRKYKVLKLENFWTEK